MMAQPYQTSPTQVLRFVVKLIIAELDVDQVFVAAYRSEATELEPVLDYPKLATSQLKSALEQQIIAVLAADSTGPQMLPPPSEAAEFAAGLIVPLWVHDEITGVLALYARRSDAFALNDLQRISEPLSMIHTVLENLYLYDALAQNIIISQLILITAQTIVDNPSPQKVIDILREQLFDSHITSCAILLYGPTSEDRPYGPFDYLEMAGSWSRRRGSGIALGTKIYLDQNSEYLQRLDKRETLMFANDLPDFIARQDPFVRSILRVERLRALTMLPLHAGPRKIGVLLLGADRPHVFTQQEMATYQMVGEFLGIGAMSQILQQQHDLVQQARAALLDAVNDGVVMVLPDAAGARVLTVNKLFTNMFGLDEQTARGLLLPELLDKMQIPQRVHDSLRDRWLGILVRDSVRLNGEFHMIHHEGYPLDIEWYSAPVYRDQHVLGRIYTFHDVTAERTAVRVRSDFLSRVSHELRTPLTSIHGFAEFILEVVGNDLPPLAREYTEIILGSARQLRTIFNDMIELTQADAGELQLNMRPAHLPDVVINTTAQLEFQYKSRDQTVLLQLDDEVPSVNIDVDRITQVLANLLTNAIKFSAPGSVIEVGTLPLLTAADLPDSAPPDVPLPGVLAYVWDEGEGIAAADVSEIFTPFFRTNWARQKQIEGTGLGLAVARSIIELHRGRIWAEAGPGGRFFFSLPVIAD